MKFKKGDRVHHTLADVDGTVVGHREGFSNDLVVQWDGGWDQLCHSGNCVPEAESPTTESPRAELLAEAKALVTGDRNNQYGPPTQDFARTAEFWNVMFSNKLKDGERFTSTDVGLAMVLLKMSRLVWQKKRDSFADLAGYSACSYECSVEQQ